MESAVLGLVLDSSVLIAAERQKLTTPQAVRKVRETAGDVTIVICPLTVAELAHGIYRADTPERSRMRRQFLDELKAHVPIHPITESTGEIVARVGAEQAAKGIVLPLADLIIGACALELGYAVGTGNLRDFSRIPGLTVVRL
ncbi:MAG TPA: PIN domain-containing protein [Bryobacteraceae bacterium]|nr:PIN domain-containing protein [Bryobacteraceae bacterium]